MIECQETEASILLPGDRVLVRNMSERGGTGKLRSFLDNKIHIVLETYGENPVLFRIQAEMIQMVEEKTFTAPTM